MPLNDDPFEFSVQKSREFFTELGEAVASNLEISVPANRKFYFYLLYNPQICNSLHSEEQQQQQKQQKMRRDMFGKIFSKRCRHCLFGREIDFDLQRMVTFILQITDPIAGLDIGNEMLIRKHSFIDHYLTRLVNNMLLYESRTPCSCNLAEQDHPGLVQAIFHHLVTLSAECEYVYTKLYLCKDRNGQTQSRGRSLMNVTSELAIRLVTIAMGPENVPKQVFRNIDDVEREPVFKALFPFHIPIRKSKFIIVSCFQF